MLDLAAEKGIDTLDTAVGYGTSETCLGNAGVRGFKLVTKLPPIPENCADVYNWMQNQIEASLARLGVESIYGLLLHRPEQLLDAEGKAIHRALLDLKEAGLTRKIGISVYAPKELEALVSLFSPDLVQAPFNLVDRRLHTSGWLKRLKDEGIEIHARSAFLQGLLLLPREDIPSRFSPWSDLWNTWHEWLAARGMDAVRAALAFPLSFSEIDRVIVGADSVAQLEAIIEASGSAVPQDWPDLMCEEENLINPARWPQLLSD